MRVAYMVVNSYGQPIKDPMSVRFIQFEFHTQEMTEYLEKIENTEIAENLGVKELPEEDRILILHDWQETASLQNKVSCG